VLLYHQKLSFVEYITKDMSNSAVDILNEFHNTQINIECDKGLKDPIKEIGQFLKRISWKYNSNLYFDKQHEYEKPGIDFRLLEMIKTINENKGKCYIASNQNNYRKKYLIEMMNIETIFSGAYFSSDFGFLKSQIEFWELLFNDLKMSNFNSNKKDIIFFDDKIENIRTAQEFGITAILISKREEIEIELNRILS